MVTRTTFLITMRVGVLGLLVMAWPLVAQGQSIRETVEQELKASAEIQESAVEAQEVAAQDTPAMPREEMESEPMEAAESMETGATVEITELPPAAPPASDGAVETAAMERESAGAPEGPPTYTIQKGDTLWTISSEHLSNPYFWPKLWKVNPEVENPDLIYPGKILALPTDEEPKLEPVLTEIEETPPAEEEFVELEPIELEPIEEEPAVEPTPEEPIVATAEARREPSVSFEVQQPPPSQWREILTRSTGYIVKDPPVIGRVVGADEYRALLAKQDRIYLQRSSGASLEPLGRYVIYRKVKRVVHPVSGATMGQLITILGEVEVQDTGTDVATAMITESYRAVEPGDLLMPASYIEAAPMEPVIERTGEPLSGVVLEVVDDRLLNGQRDVIYIDRGENAGVLAGDRFRIYRKGSRPPSYAPIHNVQLPDRFVGELEVLSVQSNSATALLTSSLESIHPGDRIER